MNFLSCLFKTNKRMNYTLEELLEIFPKHDNIDRNDIKDLLDNLYENCKQYQDIYMYFENYVSSRFPGSDYKKYGYDSPEANEYFVFVHGRRNYNQLTLYEWVKKVETLYISKVGQRRTYDEACKIAADKWCELLFKFHLQDNGAINEDHGGGFWACALATVLKEDSMKEITEEMIKNTHDNIYKYYKEHCFYKSKEKDDWSGQISLYCDYGPNVPLYELLEDSGIPDKYINNICPWKTGIDIDEIDNAVIIKGYQKRKLV